MKRVTLSHAARLKGRKWYQNRHGDFLPVAVLQRRAVGPNWRIQLTDGRDFLVDPRTMVYVRTRRPRGSGPKEG